MEMYFDFILHIISLGTGFWTFWISLIVDYPAHCQPRRKRESQHNVMGCRIARTRTRYSPHWARHTTADRMAAHRKSDRRRDDLCGDGLLFPRNAKKCREAIRASVIYYCSQAFYPKGITNAWLGNAWGDHLQISPVIA